VEWVKLEKKREEGSSAVVDSAISIIRDSVANLYIISSTSCFNTGNVSEFLLYFSSFTPPPNVSGKSPLLEDIPVFIRERGLYCLSEIHSSFESTSESLALQLTETLHCMRALTPAEPAFKSSLSQSVCPSILNK
jgi:hypothetical protein